MTNLRPLLGRMILHNSFGEYEIYLKLRTRNEILYARAYARMENGVLMITTGRMESPNPIGVFSLQPVVKIKDQYEPLADVLQGSGQIIKQYDTITYRLPIELVQ